MIRPGDIGPDELRALADDIDRQHQEHVEARRYIRRALRRIIRRCAALRREWAAEVEG